MSRDWDAATYDRVSTPQVEWARPVIDRLDLAGGETVLDAGCGSGRVTELLLERLPEGRVIAVDSSPSMIEQARQRLRGRRVELLESDLAELRLDDQVDAVFSNAVFHWVPDHEALFAALFGTLRPGGRLVAQCGGQGNVKSFLATAAEVGEREPFGAHLTGWVGPWHFAGAAETGERLRRAGFDSIEVWLEPWPVIPEHTEEFLRTVCLGHHILRLPEELRDRYVRAVAEQAGQPVELDYVRLNINAIRPA